MPPKSYKKTFNNKNSNSEESVNRDAKYLFIVESPSKCAKIEHFLGQDYCCIASKGHIRKIDGLKSIDTKDTFTPTFTIIDEKREHVKKMRKIIEMFSPKTIYL